MVLQEETRKGPWTEQEDTQLVFYVNMFGDRRWDFVAKVSGLQRWRETRLKRTGKSCRLRWVNYLHPGLKRGKMTPHEECLVLELHAKWGNRWSRIARKLPGRTDNEIKNYWRTHMRKKAQEMKRANMSTSSTTLSSASVSSLSSISFKAKRLSAESVPLPETKGGSFYDTGGFTGLATGNEDLSNNVCTLDEIWKDIELSEDNCVKPIFDGFSEVESYFSCQTMVSPPTPLWQVEDPPSIIISDRFYSFCNLDNSNMLITH